MLLRRSCITQLFKYQALQRCLPIARCIILVLGFVPQVRGEGPGGPFLLFTERSGLMRTLPFISLSSIELPAHRRPLGLPNGLSGSETETVVPYGASSGRGGSLATMLQAMRCALVYLPQLATYPLQPCGPIDSSTIQLQSNLDIQNT